jgi:chromate reductase, NAD(P)H dehydrogenase (quinone)
MCGSFGQRSANGAALEHAGRYIVGTGRHVSVVSAALEAVPVFDPRLANEPPVAVVELSEMLTKADGVMIAAPEYAGGLAGGTKTALDWMVGLASLYRRPVVVMSAGTTGGEFAIDQLVRTLSWQGALVVGTLGIAAPRTKIDDSGRVVDSETARSIERWSDHLLAAIAAEPRGLRHRVSEVVTRYGIDAERFGDLD